MAKSDPMGTPTGPGHSTPIESDRMAGIDFDHDKRSRQHGSYAHELRDLAKRHRKTGDNHGANLISRAARHHDELASVHDEIAEHLDSYMDHTHDPENR